MVSLTASHNLHAGIRARRGAFTLIDVLVALAVIGILIGLMLPTLAMVRETTRKVVCASNIRQLGYGMAMYAQDYRGQLPFSRNYRKSLSDPAFNPIGMMTPRFASPVGFDGLGLLHAMSYGTAPVIYYCPSHAGMNRPDVYAGAWGAQSATIVSNFQYRGGSSKGVTIIDRLASGTALISDGLASQDLFNHQVGGNVVATDLSAVWYEDKGSVLLSSLPASTTESLAPRKVLGAWNLLDRDDARTDDLPDGGLINETARLP